MDRLTRRVSVGFLVAALVVLAGCGGTASPSPVPTGQPTAAPPTGAPTAAPTAGPTGAPPTAAPPTGGPTEVPAPTPELPDWTCDGTTIHLPGTVARAQQNGLGTSDDGTIGRVTFYFEAPPGSVAVPEIEVRVSKPPFVADPSGQPIEVGGSDWATIILRGGTAWDENYQSTYTGKDDIVMEGSPVKQVRRAGDFEAISTWIVGLDAPYCVRVYRASSPNGLTVEFKAK